MNDDEYSFADSTFETAEGEYLECVVVDMCKRRFACVSDTNTIKTLECNTPDEFMRVLEMCQAFLPEEEILWVDPIVATTK